MNNSGTLAPGFAGIASNKVFTVKTAAATLEPYERLVHADSTAAGFTIKLPHADIVPGAIFSVRLRTDGGDVLLVTQEPTPTTIATLDTVLDYVVVYSDGVNYIELASEKA